MNGKLTRIHIGLGMGEIGVQFEVDDGAGGVATQRGFVVVDDAALAPVWLAAQTALDAALSTFAFDFPAGEIANVLMQKRTAVAAMKVAEEAAKTAVAAARNAERARRDAESRLSEINAQIDAKREEVAALNALPVATV